MRRKREMGEIGFVWDFSLNNGDLRHTYLFYRALSVLLSTVSQELSTKSHP